MFSLGPIIEELGLATADGPNLNIGSEGFIPVVIAALIRLQVKRDIHTDMVDSITTAPRPLLVEDYTPLQDRVETRFDL